MKSDAGFAETYLPQTEYNLTESHSIILNATPDQTVGGDIVKMLNNKIILVDSDGMGAEANRRQGVEVVDLLIHDKTPNDISTYAKISIENNEVEVQALGSTAVIIWEEKDKGEVVPRICHIGHDMDRNVTPTNLKINSEKIKGWMMLTDGGINLLGSTEILQDFPDYDRFEAITAHTNVVKMSATSHIRAQALSRLLAPITSSINKVGFGNTTIILDKKFSEIKGQVQSRLAKPYSDDTTIVTGDLEKKTIPPVLPFLFAPDIFEKKITADKSIEKNSQPLTELSLNEEHIKYIEDNMDWIIKNIENLRFSSMGITFDRVLPLLFSDDKTVICIKRSRHVAPDRVIADTKNAELEWLARGENRFAPSILMGDFIIQLGLLSKPGLSEDEKRAKLAKFSSELDQKGISLDNFGDNVVITEYGPATMDVMSGHFSKARN